MTTTENQKCILKRSFKLWSGWERSSRYQQQTKGSNKSSLLLEKHIKGHNIALHGYQSPVTRLITGVRQVFLRCQVSEHTLLTSGQERTRQMKVVYQIFLQSQENGNEHSRKKTPRQIIRTNGLVYGTYTQANREDKLLHVTSPWLNAVEGCWPLIARAVLLKVGWDVGVGNDK